MRLGIARLGCTDGVVSWIIEATDVAARVPAPMEIATMDLTGLRPWLALIHVLAAFGFFAVHGASMIVMLRLRGERDRARIGTLLDVSASSIGLLYGFLGLLLLAGILGGIAGGWWTSGRWWLWTAVALLVLVIGAMYGLMTPYYGGLRNAVGLQTQSDVKAGRMPVPASDEELAVILASTRPLAGAAIGIIGMVLIVWLMMAKPF